MQISDIARKVVKEIQTSKGSLDSIFFGACGGSIAAFYPCKYLLETESTKIRRVGYYSSNEFVYATPKSIGENSLFIACSHQGNTPETVEALKLAKKLGATTIGFTYEGGSLLGSESDYEITYEWGPDSKPSNQKASMGLKLIAAILKEIENWSGYESLLNGFDRIDNLVATARSSVKEFSQIFAKANMMEKIIYTIGSGATFGSAYMEDICILKEMQWIHSASIHSGEFFHGPLEITDTETPFLLLMSEGKTRFLDERVLTFLKRYARKVYVLDVKNFGINTIDDSVVDYFSPLLLTNVLDVINNDLAEKRKHPLATRRYMWKVEY